MAPSEAEVTIRRMQPADLPQVLELLRSCNLEPMAPSPAVPHPERTTIVVENTAVAVAGGRVVGVLSFILLSPTEAEGASLAVYPEYRGRGIRERLVYANRREMHERGIRKAYTETDSPEHARWLLAHGGRIVGTVPKRHPFGNPQVDHWTRIVVDLDTIMGD